MVLACSLGSLGVMDSSMGVPVGSSIVQGMATRGSQGVCMDHLGQRWALNDVARMSRGASSRLPQGSGHVLGDI